MGMKITLGFSIGKIIVGSLLLLIQNCGFTEYTLWIILSLVQSIICAIYNLRSLSIMTDPNFVEEIGEKLF